MQFYGSGTTRVYVHAVAVHFVAKVQDCAPAGNTNHLRRNGRGDIVMGRSSKLWSERVCAVAGAREEAIWDWDLRRMQADKSRLFGRAGRAASRAPTDEATHGEQHLFDANCTRSMSRVCVCVCV